MIMLRFRVPDNTSCRACRTSLPFFAFDGLAVGKAGENVFGDQHVIVILLGKFNHIHKIHIHKVHIPLAVNSRHYDPRPSIFASAASSQGIRLLLL